MNRMVHTGLMPTWQGTTLCSGLTRRGKPCFCWAIEGLDYCLHHVPDADLELAEAIIGFRRCRHLGCLMYAVACSSPPRCKAHGCNQGSAMYVRAQLRARTEEILGLRVPRKKKRLVPVKVIWRSVA